MRARRAAPQALPEELLDGPLGPLLVFAREQGLSSLDLIRLRSNRRRAAEGGRPRYQVDDRSLLTYDRRA